MPSLVNKVKAALKNKKEQYNQNRKIAKQQRLREKTAFEQARRKERVKLAAKAGRARARQPSAMSRISTGITTMSGLGSYDPFGDNKPKRKPSSRKKTTIKVNGQTITITGNKRSTKKTTKKKKKNEIFNPLDF